MTEDDEDKYSLLAALPNSVGVDVHNERLVFAAPGLSLEINQEYPDFSHLKAYIESYWELIKDKGLYKRYKPFGRERPVISHEKELCLFLDWESRGSLRQACKKGYINRSHYKQWGVDLLVGLDLIIKTKTHETMYRYEPTDLGRRVAEYLPSDDAEWDCTMGDKDLIYGDGTSVPKSEVVSYAFVRDYHEVIRKVKSS